MPLHGPASPTPSTLTTWGTLDTGACRPGLPLVSGQHVEPSTPPLAWRRSTELPPPGLLPLHWRASQWPQRVSPMPPSRPGQLGWLYHPGSQVCSCAPMYLEVKRPMREESCQGLPNMCLWPRTWEPTTYLCVSICLSLSLPNPPPASLGMDLMGTCTPEHSLLSVF